MTRVSHSLYTAAALAGAYTGLSFLMARGLTRSARNWTEDTPATVGMAYESVWFPSQVGNVMLGGWLCPPAGSPHMRQAFEKRWIVLAHGHGSSSSDPTTGILGLARDLHDKGFGVLLFDFCGSGRSEGDRTSAGFYERYDLLGALDYLSDRGVQRERIGILGLSMGGAAALMAAAVPGVAGAVVADSSFADLGLMIKRAQSGLATPVALANPGMRLIARLLYGIRVGDVSPVSSISVSDLPSLIVHGQEDNLVPVSHARILAKAAGPSGGQTDSNQETAWIVPGAGHTAAYRTNPTDYVERVSAFFGTHLGTPVRHDDMSL